MLKPGDAAPEFTLKNSDGKEISLKDFRGKKVILYFYPKDDTSGCTNESCDFRDNHKTFEDKNAVIIGISKDSVESHKKFQNKYGLPFTLLSDESTEVNKKYGVWVEKINYGKKYMGTSRTTFVIDEEGKIQEVFNNVKVDGHIEEILNKI